MKILFLFSLFLLFISCSTAQKNFAKDRGNDLGDIVSFSFDGGLGLQVSISAISTGIGFSTSVAGYKYAKFQNPSDFGATFIFGYKNNQFLHIEDFKSDDTRISDDYYILRNKFYTELQPFKKNLYGRIKIRTGLIIGATVEFNFYELFDFIVGFWDYDLLDDDWNSYYEKIIRAEKAKRNTNSQPIKSK